MDITSDDAVPASEPTQTTSDTDLNSFVYEGQSIEICGTIDLYGCEIDSDLNITIPLSIEFPKYKKSVFAGNLIMPYHPSMCVSVFSLGLGARHFH